MYFASKWVLDADSDEEVVEEDELQYSDCEDESDSSSDREEERKRKEEKQKKQQKIRKADTNVVSVNFGTLKDAEAQLMTGDPVFCKSCKAIFSALSKTKDGLDHTKTWTCEFCETENTVNLEDEEMPKNETADYILEAFGKSLNNNSASSSSEAMIIFCIDVSGSMCVTTEVDGKFKLKGQQEKLDKLNALNNERQQQYLPNQKRNVTYVSRLECVQAAIDSQIQELSKTSPHMKVGIVTFNNDITVIGDGTQQPVIITGDKLNNYEVLVETATSLQSKMTKSVKDTAKSLSEKVFKLEEGGSTALGSGLLVSIGLASKSPGSKVIICTDGLANVGVGALDADNQEAELFYNRVSSYAQQAGVVVSIVSIKGDDCKLEYLGGVSDTTGGNVNVVDPIKLTSEFHTMLADELVATHVKASLLLHKGLYLRDDTNEETSEQKNYNSKLIGNVTKDTEITFEYGIRKDNHNNLKVDALPFQVQIEYTKLDGVKCIRVISKSQPLTHDRNLAEKDADIVVLTNNVAQQSAKLAMEGEYTQARLKAFANKKLLKTVVANDQREQKESEKEQKLYKKYKSKMRHLDSTLEKARNQEERDYGQNLSDDEDDARDVKSAPGIAPSSTSNNSVSNFFGGFFSSSKKSEEREKDRDRDRESRAREEREEEEKKMQMKKKKMARKQARSDSTANELYRMKKENFRYSDEEI